MRRIKKSKTEPSALLAYRKSAGSDASWDGFVEKDAVREQLLRDQGGLCCYCMRRIDKADMKEEHYLSRSRHPEHALTWSNLLAACAGNEGQPKALQTCDTAKGNAALRIDPKKAAHVESLRYRANGRIETPEFSVDINETLNLNTESLRQQRAEALTGFYAEMHRRVQREGAWTARQFQNELDRLEAKHPLPPFCGMFEWWLKKKLRSASAS
jgi:uncharacterized protein (TIGR02646 family)